jgi:hypothetical protein
MNLNQIENDGKRNLRRLQNVASGTENGETNRENGCCSQNEKTVVAPQNEKAMISTPREQCIHTEGVPDSIPASPTILRLLANIPGVACVEATTPRGRSFAMRITYRGTPWP